MDAVFFNYELAIILINNIIKFLNSEPKLIMRKQILI